jgi:hypothetical protein
MEELPRLLGQRLVDGELELYVDMRFGEPRWVSRRVLERRGQDMRWAIEQHLARPENRTLLEMAPSADDSTFLQPARSRGKGGFIRKRRPGREAPDNDEAEEESFVAEQSPPPLPPLPPLPHAQAIKSKENDRTVDKSAGRTILSRFNPRK